MSQYRASAGVWVMVMMGSGIACTGDDPPLGGEVGSREAALLAVATADDRRVSAAAESLEVSLADLEPGERLAARAQRLDEEVALLRADPELDLATLRVTAAAMRARFYEDVGDEELAASAWDATDEDQRNAAALGSDIARRPSGPPDPSFISREGLVGPAVAPPSLEDLMRAPVPATAEVTRED